MSTIVGPSAEQRTLSVHKEHEVLQKLEAGGLNDQIAQKIIESKGNQIAKKLIMKAEELIVEESVFKIDPILSFDGLKEGKEFLFISPEISNGKFKINLDPSDNHPMDIILIKCWKKHLENKMFEKFKFVPAAHLLGLGLKHPEVIEVCRYIMSLHPTCYMQGSINEKYHNAPDYFALNYFNHWPTIGKSDIRMGKPGPTLSFDRENLGEDTDVWFAVTPM